MTYFPPHPRDVNRTRVRDALRASFPDGSPIAQDELADSLTVIAEALDIPIESLIFWIHDKPTGKDFSLHAWRVWCARYSSARDLLPPESALEPQTEKPAAPEPVQEQAICSSCWSQAVRQIDGHWWCPRCGEVQQ